MNSPTNAITSLYRNEYTFAAKVMQWAFGLYFLLVGVKKFRVDGHLDPVNGLFAFANSLTEGAMGTQILAREIPGFLLYGYGLGLPFMELAAGILLLVNRHVRIAFALIAGIYLSFIFGQMYSGNTGKVGTDYLPSLVALCVAVFAWVRSRGAEGSAGIVG